MRVLVTDDPNRPHAQAGQVLELPDAEARQLILTGGAVATDAPVSEPPAAPAPDPSPVDDPPAEGASLTDADETPAAEETPEPDAVVPARVRRRQTKPKPVPPASARRKRR